MIDFIVIIVLLKIWHFWAHGSKIWHISYFHSNSRNNISQSKGINRHGHDTYWLRK